MRPEPDAATPAMHGPSANHGNRADRRWASLVLTCILCLAVAFIAQDANAVRAIGSTPSPAVLEAQARRIEVIDRAKDAVLAIFPLNGQGGGSGVVISPDGYALTNYHVVLPCGHAMRCGMADGRVYDAVLVGLDPTGDVALIKLFGRDDFPYAAMADSDDARVGNWVFAAGNPFLLATDFQPTITQGIVSGIHRYQFPAGTLLEYADCIQTDAQVNPGNSGGPLFDDRGQVVGINGRCSFEKRGRVNVGLAYAISINQIKNFMGTLRSGRVVDHATLGATLGRDADGRVIVTDILDSSDVYRRGMRYGDEVISFAGRHVASPNAFKNALGIFPAGWRVPMSFRRDGQRYDILARLASVHHKEELLQKMNAGPRPEPKSEKDPQKPSPGEPDEQIERPRDAKQNEPEVVKEHYRSKRGFANYYYNESERRRVWDAWKSQFHPDDASGEWLLGGPLSGGGRFGLTIGSGAARLELPSSSIDWTAGDELGKSLLPRHSGGMLPALYLWRRLAVEGLERFGDVFYYGTAPLAGYEGLADVLVGSHKGVDCRFYFDPGDGRLLALEMFPGEDSDPCEIYFSEYHRMGQYMPPGKIEVRCGDEPFATLRIDEFKIEK